MADRKTDPYGVETSESKSRESETPTHVKSSSLFSDELHDGVHVITFSKSDVLDAYEIERLGDEIYRHVKTIERPRLVIDLDKVRHLSSAALGMLVALKKVVEKKDGRICLANVRDDIRKVFKITKLDKMLKIHNSAEKAVGSLT